MISISVHNRSTLVSDAEVARVTEAVQIQADRDFAPFWGIRPRYKFHGKSPWTLIVVDDSVDPSALGEHMGSSKFLLPSPVARKQSRADSRLNPFVCYVVRNGDELYALEDCDAVQDNQFAYTVKVGRKTVVVSDFVTPAWFGMTNGRQFDFCGHVNRPFQILPLGYAPIESAATGKRSIVLHSGNTLHGSKIPAGSRKARWITGRLP